MRCRAPAPVYQTIALTLALASAAAAQVTYRAGFFVGAYHASVVDPVASELRYSGGGPALGLLLARAGARSVLELTADYQRSRLGSTLTGAGAARDVPRERATIAGLQARRLWAGRPLAGGRLRPGVAFRGEVAVRDHWYAEPPVAFTYLLGAGALGPAAAWSRPFAGGELSADAALPLLGVVYRPYSDAESVGGDRLRFRLATLDRLRAPAAGATWAVPFRRGGRARAVAAWRFHYLRYRDYTVYREARQSLTASVELPLGGRP